MRTWSAVGMLLVASAAFGQGSADQKQLDQLTASYKSAKAAYKKSHGGKQKKNYLVATDKLATATMTSEVLSPRLRYPQALGLYQEALNVDPADREAANNASMIDGVYKGMIAKSKAKLAANPKDTVAAAEYTRLTSVYKKIHRPIP